MEYTIMQREIEWHTKNVADKWEPELIRAEELRKYKKCKDWKFNPKQMLFRQMGSLRGKRIMDFGSGQGVNGVEMALLGANVEGFDICPGLVEKSEMLARINNVDDRCHFYVGEATSSYLGYDIYDIVLVDNVLHHLPHDELGGVVRKLKNSIKPGGKVIIREPVTLSNFYNRLKSLIPIRQPSTPDERELSREELDIILRNLGSYEIHYYGLLGRVARYTSGVVHNVAMRLDRMLFGLLTPIRQLAGTVVIVAGK